MIVENSIPSEGQKDRTQCFEKQEKEIQNKCEFFTSWHSICKLECVYMNCYGCQEILITPRQRASYYQGCIEQYLNNKLEISHGNIYDQYNKNGDKRDEITCMNYMLFSSIHFVLNTKEST